MRAIASGKEYLMPSTIDDPAILEEITETLTGIGYPNSAKLDSVQYSLDGYKILYPPKKTIETF